jgi:hypothetical protein
VGAAMGIDLRIAMDIAMGLCPLRRRRVRLARPGHWLAALGCVLLAS